MTTIAITALILFISALSVVLAAAGIITKFYLSVIGFVGITGTSAAIFKLKFPVYRAWLHFVILVLLSFILVPLMKKYLTNES